MADLPNNMRPSVKFLTVVWGEAYIARFADLALPSFLAPGNLPSLAEATELEVVIMTRHSDVAYFEKHATFRRLQSICPVRFVEIDDLITTSVYGVTLTLAYARPIIACGSEMLNTHFVFMNADFVLADGSLRSLCRHILAGRSIVLGPSFRAMAEKVEPVLDAAVDAATGVLSMAPRQMTSLALAHPHATTVAKTRTQDLCHSTHPNQFFWQVDEQTLLGRYYLIFMLCLKPERVITTINSFCDYALIPETCPSGDEVVMGDSDEFFMLELQHRNQEMEMLRLGMQPENETAKSLQQWTTAEHRRAAGYDIVFHAGDIPAGIETVKTEAQAYIDRIGKKLRRPISHAGHHYWIRGVEAWKTYRKAQKLPVAVPELATPWETFAALSPLSRLLHLLRQQLWSLAYQGHRAVLGQSGHITLMNPEWPDQNLLKNTIIDIISAGEPLLVVRGNAAPVDHLVPAGADVIFVTPRELCGGIACAETLARFRHALVYLPRENSATLRQLVECCLHAIKGTCHVIIHDKEGSMNSLHFAMELLALIESDNSSDYRAVQHAFVGGSLTRINRRLLGALQRNYSRFGPPALLWVLPLLAIVIPLVLITNLRSSRKISSHYPSGYCSSILIQFRPLQTDLCGQTGDTAT